MSLSAALGPWLAAAWPGSIFFPNPPTHAARAPPKGDLIVSCLQSGLTASLKVAKDSSVQGVLEQTEPAGGGGAAGGAAGGLPLAGAAQKLGVFGGSWRSQVYISCPGMVGWRCTSAAGRRAAGGGRAGGREGLPACPTPPWIQWQTPLPTLPRACTASSSTPPRASLPPPPSSCAPSTCGAPARSRRRGCGRRSTTPCSTATPAPRRAARCAAALRLWRGGCLRSGAGVLRAIQIPADAPPPPLLPSYRPPCASPTRSRRASPRLTSPAPSPATPSCPGAAAAAAACPEAAPRAAPRPTQTSRRLTWRRRAWAATRAAAGWTGARCRRASRCARAGRRAGAWAARARARGGAPRRSAGTTAAARCSQPHPLPKLIPSPTQHPSPTHPCSQPQEQHAEGRRLWYTLHYALTTR
jgi:hypothetical protein